MLAGGVHAADHGTEVETGGGRSQTSPPDVVDSTMTMRRKDIITVHHGRGSTVEAGAENTLTEIVQ